MNTIICDTNIWYGDLNLSNTSRENKLIGTAVNIIEISSSPNLQSNIKEVYSAIKRFIDFNTNIVNVNPIEYLIKTFFTDFIPDTKVIDNLLLEFELFLTIDIDELSTKGDILEMKRRIDKIDGDKQYFSEIVNQRLPVIRENIKKVRNKKQHRKILFHEYWKEFIIEHVKLYSKKYLGQEIVININDPKWSNFHFFLTVWELFFKELELRGNGKVDKNDIPDLFNLVYVKPDMKYWTKESKWNNLILSDDELKQYLYRP